MKAIKHFKNRFEYALKGSGSIKVNQNDIDALNALIKEENTKKRNASLEDSLILFYVLSCYKVQNQKNKAILQARKPDEVRFPLGMPEASTIINRLTNLIDPKHEVMTMIADELWIYQEYERIPKDKEKYLSELEEGISSDGKDVVLTKQNMIPIANEDRITFEEVKNLLEKAIEYAKNNFPMLRALDNDFIEFIQSEPLSQKL